jgi:hypothetical protein
MPANADQPASCADFECELAEFNGEGVHVRLFVNFPPKVALSRPVNSLKGVSRRMRQEFPDLRRHSVADEPPVVAVVLRRVGWLSSRLEFAQAMRQLTDSSPARCLQRTAMADGVNPPACGDLRLRLSPATEPE